MESSSPVARSPPANGRPSPGQTDGSPSTGSPRSPNSGSPRGGSPRGGSPGSPRNRKEELDRRRRGFPPTCKCCVTFCPCFICFHPETLLDREELIEEMRRANKGRQVNMQLIEDQILQDRERRRAHRALWKRRWAICCCCCCAVGAALSVVLIVVFSVAAWTMLCSGSSCGFEARAHFGAAFAPGGSIFVIGGAGGAGNLGDVWRGGADGRFQRLVDSAPFNPRHGHALLCDPGSGRLYVIAGDSADRFANETRLLRDVWTSLDGREWSLMTAQAPWEPRKFFGAVADESGTLYIAGGLGTGGTGGLADVWRSADGGRSWQAVTLGATWTARHSLSLVRLPGGTRQGRLYILGGDDGRRRADVWVSDDNGGTWVLMTFTQRREQRYDVVQDQASWTARAGLRAVADSSGLLTVLGGETDGAGTDRLSREVWQLPSPPSTSIAWYASKTKDPRLDTDFSPLSWTLLTLPPWSSRHGHQAIIDDGGYPYVIGGEDADGLVADLWKMQRSFNINNVPGNLETQQEVARKVASQVSIR